MADRIIRLAAVAFVSTATVCSTSKAIAVAPPPGASLDSAARVAFALVERVSARRGLEPHDLGEADRAQTCFAERSLVVCGKVNSPEVQFFVSQVKSIGFTPWADSVWTELLDGLRIEFGSSRVRECKWQWPRDGCPPLRDST